MTLDRDTLEAAAQLAGDCRSDAPEPGGWNDACRHIEGELRSLAAQQEQNTVGRVSDELGQQISTTVAVEPVPAVPEQNAAPQERQPSDQGRVNPVRSHQAGTTPAGAAPLVLPEEPPWLKGFDRSLMTADSADRDLILYADALVAVAKDAIERYGSTLEDNLRKSKAYNEMEERAEAAEALVAALRKKYGQLEAIEGFLEPPARSGRERT